MHLQSLHYEYLWWFQLILEKIFAVFEHYDISVDAITTSEVSIAVTIDASEYPDGDFGDEFLAALQALGTVRIEKDMALVAIVGNHLHCTPGIGSRIFDAIKDINVRMVTQGASTHNFCLIVADSDVISAVQSLHQKLESFDYQNYPTQDKE